MHVGNVLLFVNYNKTDIWHGGMQLEYKLSDGITGQGNIYRHLHATDERRENVNCNQVTHRWRERDKNKRE